MGDIADPIPVPSCIVFCLNYRSSAPFSESRFSPYLCFIASLGRGREEGRKTGRKEGREKEKKREKDRGKERKRKEKKRAESGGCGSFKVQNFDLEAF